MTVTLGWAAYLMETYLPVAVCLLVYREKDELIVADQAFAQLLPEYCRSRLHAAHCPCFVVGLALTLHAWSFSRQGRDKHESIE